VAGQTEIGMVDLGAGPPRVPRATPRRAKHHAQAAGWLGAKLCDHLGPVAAGVSSISSPIRSPRAACWSGRPSWQAPPRSGHPSNRLAAGY